MSRIYTEKASFDFHFLTKWNKFFVRSPRAKRLRCFECGHSRDQLEQWKLHQGVSQSVE